MTLWRLHQADARKLPLEAGSVHTCVTSPPYWQLRRYQGAGPECIGEEPTAEEYMEHLLEVFRDVKRVLRDDGTLWINLGDVRGTTEPRYSLNLLMLPERFALMMQQDGWILRDVIVWHKLSTMPESVGSTRWEQCRVKVGRDITIKAGLEQSRPSEANSHHPGPAASPIWSPCPGCDKCRDTDGLALRRGSWRCTDAWEHVFMFVKGQGYFADGEGMKTPAVIGNVGNRKVFRGLGPYTGGTIRDGISKENQVRGNDGFPTAANLRNVWPDIKPEPYAEKHCSQCLQPRSKRQIRQVEDDDGQVMLLTTCCQAPLLGHYATFPPALPARCIAASTSEKGVCPRCGANWGRVVDHTPGLIRGGSWQDELGHEPQTRTRENGATRTLSWKPTCRCPAAEPVPALVLDPFCGVGSTLLAAARLGRRSVGTDLSAQYLELARQRLETQAPRF